MQNLFVLFLTIQFGRSKQFQCQKTVLFQAIQFGRSKQFQCQKIVLFQAIQFSKSTQFSSIRPIDGTLSGATTPS